VTDFLEEFFSANFMPHGHCFLWRPELLWLHVLSDLVIFLSYFTIPLALVYFARKRADVSFDWIFRLFSAFIFACGVTHLLGAVTMWEAYYWIQGSAKAMTAIISAVTAIMIWPLAPRALAVPSPAQLQQTNEALRLEIDERARVENALREARDGLEVKVAERTAALRRSNEDLERFAYAASHDLREPLRKIRGFGRLLQGNVQGLDATQSDYLARIVNASERMESLISNLLQYSRIGADSPPKTWVELGKVAREALENLEALVRETQARVELRPLPRVLGDATLLRQLFQNLFANAFKYAKADVPPRIIVSALTDQGQAAGGVHRIVVEDNGIGFDMRFARQIFEPFKQLHGPSRYEGAGMGLAICNRIVQEHGGSIEAQGTPGKGSRFLIALPTAGPAEKSAPAETKGGLDPEGEMTSGEEIL